MQNFIGLQTNTQMSPDNHYHYYSCFLKLQPVMDSSRFWDLQDITYVPPYMFVGFGQVHNT